MTSKLLTPAESAARARVSPSMIYQWCDERRLPHYRAGGKGKRGKILIDAADLDAFMASLRVDGDGPGEEQEELRIIR